jgi:hypothetical protein
LFKPYKMAHTHTYTWKCRPTHWNQTALFRFAYCQGCTEYLNSTRITCNGQTLGRNTKRHLTLPTANIPTRAAVNKAGTQGHVMCHLNRRCVHVC